MVTRQTLLLYHFGACAAFVVMGLLSPYVIEAFLPTVGKEVNLPPLRATALKELRETQDMERLRAQAVFYYELSRDFKRAQSAVEQEEVHAVRFICYILAGVLGLGGLLTLAARIVSTPPRPGHPT